MPVEMRIEPCRQSVKPLFDVVEPRIDSRKACVHTLRERVDPCVKPSTQTVDPRSEVEQRAERHRRKDRQRRPDRRFHLVASVAPGSDIAAGLLEGAEAVQLLHLVSSLKSRVVVGLRRLGVCLKSRRLVLFRRPEQIRGTAPHSTQQVVACDAAAPQCIARFERKP